MPLVISDDMLKAAGLSEREAKLEIACRWFDAGKWTLGAAATFAGLSEMELEVQLEARGIPRFRYTETMLNEDVATLKKLGRW